MKLSIIIPAYNEEKYIEKTLSEIQTALNKNSDLNFLYEIIVCDNNSTDDTAAICHKMKVSVVFEARNCIASARNTGAGKATGDWLLFIDADSYPDHKLIKDVILAIQSNKYIGIGGIGNCGKTTLWYWIVVQWTNHILKKTNNTLGAFLACEKNAFVHTGGFNEAYYYLEEMDFLQRLKSYGIRNSKEFITLSEHPYLTSGRRGYQHKAKEFRKLVLMGLNDEQSRKNKSFWQQWYSR